MSHAVNPEVLANLTTATNALAPLGLANFVFVGGAVVSSQEPLDSGYRLLALMCYWNIIQYWFPYRDKIEGDWSAVLREFTPRFTEADTWDSYRLELFALIARIEDTHANLWSELEVRPPLGNCFWPVALRLIEGEATVTGFLNEDSNLELGDVIKQVDGQATKSLIDAWRPYYSASNEPARLRDIARLMPRGECGESSLVIERDGETQSVSETRQANLEPARLPHDRPGETFQLLSAQVAYLKLSDVQADDVDSYVEQVADTQGLIIDIRNYPSDFMVFALGSRLVEGMTAFVRFTNGDLSNPGTFSWTQPLTLQPDTPTYKGKVVVLVDESSISNSEYTAMAFRAAPGAVVIGSTTAGADGNISPIPLPGGLETVISGIGVFYPDKTPTQQGGIVPDISVTPTLAGIKEERDEVLEEAL